MEELGSIAPHGGVLIDRRLPLDRREAAREQAQHLPQIVLGPMGLADVEMLATGAMSPLTGFMLRADYARVVTEMRLSNGTVWSIPVTLPVSTEQAAAIHEGQEVALAEGDGHILAVMTVQEKFGYDKKREAREVYRTEEDKHPGVARLYKQGDVLLGGPLAVIDLPANREFIEFRHAPGETRRMFDRRGWKTIVAFQTRNPIHRSHEYIQKVALEIVDGLLLHPLVGETQASDIPADVRMASYQAILRDYYPPDRVLLGVFPAAMRYAGPREAIFHALCRKNYGCTHFIVGRDHAGVGKYYGTYDAQKIFENFEPEEIGITPLMFENTFYCKKCGGIVSAKTCPHGEEDRVIFSGTEVRRRLETGEPIPPEFTRPEVYRVLVEGMRAKRGGQGEGETRRQGDKATGRHAQADQESRPVWGGRKVLVVGLDCAEPSLVFDRWRQELPNLNRLMSGGVYGNLESCIPAITVPAWSVMMSSQDPGQLGIYGFRNRADYSYDKMTIATGSAVKADRVWDILSRAGKQVVTVGVPGTYPPRPVNGAMVSCFLTPNTTKSAYTYPPELKDQIAAWVGDYQVDVPQFRTEDKDFLLKQIYDMTGQHFVVVKKLLADRPWDFFMFVEMGVDRIHHGMWKYTDPAHPKFEPGNPWQDSIRDYYKKLDGYIGEALALVPQDTAVLVVSDHGAKTMQGGIAVNEWLIRNGWLVLKSEAPQMITPFEKVEVDWTKTRAWGSGGYYGRVFLNVQGREPHGIIPPADYERVRDELARALQAIPAPDGRDINTVAFKPEKIYRQVKGIPPDLIVYFGNLDWRAVGSLGLGGVYTFENDTGPDDANHAQQGLYILHDPANLAGGRRLDAHIMDIAPTVLDLMGLPVPRDMNGNVIRIN